MCENLGPAGPRRPAEAANAFANSKKAIISGPAMKWTVETLNHVVDAELEDLPADMGARFVYISRLIEEFGLERVREPHVKHLRGPL